MPARPPPRGAGKAHLVVANHDLLLRWPPDYPSFEHAIVDEAHELAEVADEAYALEVRPDEVLDRIDELFGRPRPGERARKGDALVSLKNAAERNDVAAWRRALDQDLARARPCAAPGERRLRRRAAPGRAGPRVRGGARARELGGRAHRRGRRRTPRRRPRPRPRSSARSPICAARPTRSASRRRASGTEAVASFEGVEAPFDRWRLVVRLVSPADAFHESSHGARALVRRRLGQPLRRSATPSPRSATSTSRSARASACSASRCRARSPTRHTCASSRCAAAGDLVLRNRRRARRARHAASAAARSASSRACAAWTRWPRSSPRACAAKASSCSRRAARPTTRPRWSRASWKAGPCCSARASSGRASTSPATTSRPS